MLIELALPEANEKKTWESVNTDLETDYKDGEYNKNNSIIRGVSSEIQVSPANICEANNLLTDAGGETATENEKGCLLHLP